MAKNTAEQAGKAAADQPRRTVFILYIPGGAMLGIIPVAVLMRLKELTELSAVENFQVFCGVSTGSIPAGGLNIRHPDKPNTPKLSEEESLQLFCEQGPSIFAPIPHRFPKMITANVISLMSDTIDPLRRDQLQIQDIRALCRTLRAAAAEDRRPYIDELEAQATKQWFTRRDQSDVLKKCDELREANPSAFADSTRKISELVYVRHTSNFLSKVFRKSVLGGMSLIRAHWANNYLFDPQIPQAIYESIFGDARLSDSLRSLYISTFDVEHRNAINFSCRKLDLFSLDAVTPSVTSKGNHKISDGVMASTANQFAFPPHKTEDGIICSDKAIIHSPLFGVSDILRHKPKDVDVKLVILGTGKHLSADQQAADRIEYNVNFGVLGNFMQGREFEEMESYTMSQMRLSLENALGRENIIEIMPRLSPHSYEESLEVPSNDTLDASPANIDRILKTAQRLLIEDDEKIRMLACMLVENARLLGQMPDDQYKRVSERLGMQVAAPLEHAAAPQPPAIPNIRDAFKTAWSRWRQKTGVIPPLSGPTPQP